MSATALPESGHESESQEISLPFGLYFGAKNCPHWSTYDANDQRAREEAERKRNVEKDRRMRQLPRLHDKLHHLKAALSDVVNLDRNGLAEAAAVHLERSAKAFANEAAQLVADMRADSAAWRANGQAAMQQLDEERSRREATPSDWIRATAAAVGVDLTGSEVEQAIVGEEPAAEVERVELPVLNDEPARPAAPKPSDFASKVASHARFTS